MEAQSTITVPSGRNYVQLRIKREPDPFFFAIDESLSNGEDLVGEVVDEHGRCLKPNESIKRSTIYKVTRAISTAGDFPLLIPVKPIAPGGSK